MNAKDQFDCETLTRWHGQHYRLQHGMAHRKRLRAQLDAGQDVSRDARYQFILESAGLVVDFLKDVAGQFDNQNPSDQCSTLDIYDILRVVESRFGLLPEKKPSEKKPDESDPT